MGKAALSLLPWQSQHDCCLGQTVLKRYGAAVYQLGHVNLATFFLHTSSVISVGQVNFTRCKLDVASGIAEDLTTPVESLNFFGGADND